MSVENFMKALEKAQLKMLEEMADEKTRSIFKSVTDDVLKETHLISETYGTDEN